MNAFVTRTQIERQSMEKSSAGRSSVDLRQSREVEFTYA